MLDSPSGVHLYTLYDILTICSSCKHVFTRRRFGEHGLVCSKAEPVAADRGYLHPAKLVLGLDTATGAPFNDFEMLTDLCVCETVIMYGRREEHAAKCKGAPAA